MIRRSHYDEEFHLYYVQYCPRCEMEKPDQGSATRFVCRPHIQSPVAVHPICGKPSFHSIPAKHPI